MAAQGRTDGSRRRLPEQRVIAWLERVQVTGGKRSSIRIARTLVRQAPGSMRAQRFLARCLLTSPVLESEAIEAEDALLKSLSINPSDAGYRLMAESIIQQDLLGIRDVGLVPRMIGFSAIHPERSLPHASRVLKYIADSGRAKEAAVVWVALFEEQGGYKYAMPAVRALVRAGEEFALEHFVGGLPALEWASPESLASIRAEQLLEEGRPEESLELLRELRPDRDRTYSLQFVRSLQESGAYADVLTYLDGVRHNLPGDSEGVARFDALWALGRYDEATDLISGLVGSFPGRLAMFERYRDAHADDPAGVRTIIDQIESGGSGVKDPWDTVCEYYFSINEVEKVLAIAKSDRIRWRLGPLGRYAAAKAHYVRRDFDAAIAQVDSLKGTTRHWEGERLRSRMLLESGHYQKAIDHAVSNGEPVGRLDEVTYFSDLLLGRHAKAFARYLLQKDVDRFERVFGSNVEAIPRLDQRVSRFVVMQNGPGDEIVFLGVLPMLHTATSRLASTCDPRLLTLLERSFPEVEFFPVERLASRRMKGDVSHSGSSGTPDLHGLMTREAVSRAKSFDRVIPSRALMNLAETPLLGAPFPAYLSPDGGIRSEMKGWLGAGSFTGLVWRSEHADAMRSIHYLDVEEFEPLLEVGGSFVCLQYDVTPSEREALAAMAPGRVIFPDHVDCRNDFEGLAALVSVCDAVVGIGSTTVELSAAVGTPTIVLYPNRFGSWRDIDGRDYWHESGYSATSLDPGAAGACVSVAAETLSELLGEAPRETSEQ